MPPHYCGVGVEVKFPIQPLLTLWQSRDSLLLLGKDGSSGSSLDVHDTMLVGKGRGTLLLFTVYWLLLWKVVIIVQRYFITIYCLLASTDTDTMEGWGLPEGGLISLQLDYDRIPDSLLGLF